MGTSENDFHDSYHDDPIEPVAPQRKKTSVLAALVLFAVGGFYLQSTLAANLSINSKTALEFGQAITQTVSCAGTPVDLTITPQSTFVNASGSGSHYFKSVTVSNIPSPGCDGVDFTISAYNDTSSTSLALFNTSSTSAVVYDKAGTFSRGLGSAGITVESSTGTFTATFTTPVAQSSNVFKLTIQSGAHSRPTYVVGDRGPGGGIVFYVSATSFTSTGSTCNTACKYLEVAPATWQSEGVSVADDSIYQWSNIGDVATGQDIITEVTESGLGGEKFNWKIGQGFYNTSVMNVVGATSAPRAAVLAYAGSSIAGQWFIPSVNELNELCKYARGQTTGNPTVACNNTGTLKTGTANDLGGFVADWYWSSSESDVAGAYRQDFEPLSQFTGYKSYAERVRPIRAF